MKNIFNLSAIKKFINSFGKDNSNQEINAEEVKKVDRLLAMLPSGIRDLNNHIVKTDQLLEKHIQNFKSTVIYNFDTNVCKIINPDYDKELLELEQSKTLNVLPKIIALSLKKLNINNIEDFQIENQYYQNMVRLKKMQNKCNDKLDVLTNKQKEALELKSVLQNIEKQKSDYENVVSSIKKFKA